jgi:predicted AAA+ superfamily ATPase
MYIFREYKDIASSLKKKILQAGWLKPVILATQEAEIRRITVQSQPRQIVHKTLSRKKTITKKGWQSEAPSSNPSIARKKKKKRSPSLRYYTTFPGLHQI